MIKDKVIMSSRWESVIFVSWCVLSLSLSLSLSLALAPKFSQVTNALMTCHIWYKVYSKTRLPRPVLHFTSLRRSSVTKRQTKPSRQSQKRRKGKSWCSQPAQSSGSQGPTASSQRARCLSAERHPSSRRRPPPRQRSSALVRLAPDAPARPA